MLMGEDNWSPGSEPVAISQLQGLGVIKWDLLPFKLNHPCLISNLRIAQGDYHFLALTASGRFFAGLASLPHLAK